MGDAARVLNEHPLQVHYVSAIDRARSPIVKFDNVKSDMTL
jgi:hypothetical protein